MRRYPRDETHRVEIVLDGSPRHGRCESRMLLSDFLRHVLGATGVHVGCEHGVCGACTVIVDGVAQRSCLALAVATDGRDVRTVHGLAKGDVLSDLQQAFHRRHALQCGFCTPGILMSSVDFLAHNPAPTERSVREMLSGHLCRCTGYTNIVAAILDVAAERRGEGRAPDSPVGAADSPARA